MNKEHPALRAIGLTRAMVEKLTLSMKPHWTPMKSNQSAGEYINAYLVKWKSCPFDDMRKHLSGVSVATAVNQWNAAHPDDLILRDHIKIRDHNCVYLYKQRGENHE